MKRETCNIIMNHFLELDKNERMPFSITFHLLICKRCRTQVRLLTQAEKTAAEPVKIPVPLNDTTIETVLKKIDPAYNAVSDSPISLLKWIVSGLLMIFLLLIFGVITNSTSSGQLLLVFYLMFAILVTVYCALFVGCNMDFFVKKIETLKLAV